jgi:hypothetical protein
MTRDTTIKLILIAVCFGVAYVFWMTYQNPRRNGLTRSVRSYMDSLHPQTGGRAYILLNAIIVLLVALAALGSLLGESFGPLRNLLP